MRYIASFVFVIGLFISLPQVTQAVSFTTNDFITTWDTENTGTSASNQITIPGTGAGYSYSIYWESLSSSTATGTIATSTSASQTITFPEPGEYKVAIKGTYPRIYFNNGGDKLKILTVEQWGNIAWTSMNSAFYGCANLTVPATDAPNLSGVTSLGQMLAGAANFNNPINHWDVSNVTTMSQMFYQASSFNQSLNSWNVSKVTNMQSVFERAWSFNQPLNNWNTASATTMTRMFYGGAATSNNPPNKFNQDISTWNTSNVTSMNLMFRNSEFNQPLNSWNVAKVTDFGEMFFESSFNQPLNNWNTASATVMYWMFLNNTNFNQPLSNWDTSRVTTMSGMFAGATAFDQDLSAWNVSRLATSSSGHLNGAKDMFYNTTLSQSNLDSTLTAWSAQSLHQNVPFHLGLKTYSSTGQNALDTLRNTYNWTITEQYQAEYQEGEDYTITGTTTQSHVSHGSTTTPVEVIPNNRCTFLKWSDDNTDNPRTDTLTDNLTLTAITKCSSQSSGNSSSSRYKKLLELGNTTEAEAVKDKYLNTTPANPVTPTLETAIINIKTLTTNPVITNNPEQRQQLIAILQQLVQILRGMAGESN